MDDNFYKYIYKHGDGYQIIKDGDSYGTYSKLTDALYERDRLIKAEWDWETCVQLEETENFYERMLLPRFIHPNSYIYEVCSSYSVYVDGELKGKFVSKRDAYTFANEIRGEVHRNNVKYLVQKTINNKQRHFGTFQNLEDAQKERDRLIKRRWVK